MQPLIDIRDFTLWLGGRKILDSIDFQVASPGLTTILGPSGAGKSTLLQAIAGRLAWVEGGAERAARPSPAAPSKCSAAPS